MIFSRSVSRNVEEYLTTTVVAIDRDKNSQQAVKWAVENLLHDKRSHCILLHVRCQSLHPQDFEGSKGEGRPPNEDELQKFFLPYRGFCARKGIEAKEVVLHDIEVPNALADYISTFSIDNIVVGASSHSAFARKLKNVMDVPTCLMKSAPESCAVYVISKGKVQYSKPASRSQMPTSATRSSSIAATLKQNSLKEFLNILPPNYSKAEDVARTSFSYGNWRNESSNRISCDNKSIDFSLTTPDNKFSKTNSLTSSLDSQASQSSSPNQYSTSVSSDFSSTVSSRSTDLSSENLEFSPDGPRNLISPHTLHGLEADLMRLKLELKQSMELYDSAHKEDITVKDRESELHQCMISESSMLEKSRHAEEVALSQANLEKQKTKAAMEAAQMALQRAEMETQKRKKAELDANCIAEERKRAMNSFVNNNALYRKYTIEEIEIATNQFSCSQKIGEGGYGPVYRGVLDHTHVAIKVLRPDLSHGQKQFQQEVEVLSAMRHPQMVILIGACPEYGCLVYEYMENGSLEDRLFQKDNTPPLPWRTRFIIAAEISTGLLFLHQAKPEALVHRDLKPANILLDRHLVSKISDVGLARLVPQSVSDSVTQYCMTAAAGTFCYIDPEYQQTGTLGVKSDVYSLGVLLLQIITAKSPMGLSHQVEEAIEEGTFSKILDPTVTDWPVEETLSFAKLALHCCEMRRRDRPDLASGVLPELNRLKDFALRNEESNVGRSIYGFSSNSAWHKLSHLNQEGPTNKVKGTECRRRFLRRY